MSRSVFAVDRAVFDHLYQRSGGPRVCKTCRKMHKLKHREKANG